MAIGRLLTQTAIIKVSVGEWEDDGEGNMSPPDPVTVEEPCRLEQTDSTEVLAGETIVLSNWRLFGPADSTIEAESEVEVDGRAYRVVGEPDFMRSPRGVHHVETRLIRKVG